MAYALAVGAVSFLVALLFGRPLIAFLRTKKMGKSIRAEGPSSHSAKSGTPTMGGLLIFITVLLVTVPFNLEGRLSMLLPLGVLIGMSILGAIDDWMSLVGSERGGMRARVKFAVQLAISVVAALVLYRLLDAHSANLPFLGKVDLGIWYVPLAALIVAGFSNAVNFTDGLDTLAGGTIALAFASYGVIAFLQGQAYLVTFCFTVVGATLAFLWFNAYPAQVFMGDTGSLALGATLAIVALMTGQWLLLPVVGAVFVIEVMSVIIQVLFFKLTGGRRVFRMTPIHHHFELEGWSESQVAMRFWLIGVVAAMVGIALALMVP